MKDTFRYDVQSWLEITGDSDFSIFNFPFGIFKTNDTRARACSAIGDYIIDLSVLYDLDLLGDVHVHRQHLVDRYLNELIESGKPVTNGIRVQLQKLFSSELADDTREKVRQALIPMSNVEMLLPIMITDYTDFYSSIEHAKNVGTMFRDPENALLPNWRHLPVGYHGRSSSIIVSGTDFHRPKGQMIAAGADAPHFGPCRLLDFELEMGFVIGKGTELGSSVSTDKAEDHIFGLILFNDWSARDIQKWEYIPLGPFLGKNFASTVSPWIVTLEALEPFRVAGPKQDPPVLPYLASTGERNYDIHLEVAIQPEGQEPHIVSRSNHKYLYWNMCQQLGHHTVNGCNINVGDMYASGTISGPTPDSYGSMLELSWKGTKPVQMPDGTERKFIQDHDTVIMNAHCEKDGIRIGFGETSGKLLPTT